MSSVMAIVGPLLFVVAGTLLVVYRVPIPRWYKELWTGVVRSDRGRMAQKWSPRNMLLVGVMAIAIGLVFGTANVVRLLN